MSNINIKYLWWIEDEKQWSSLTWSATLLTADIFNWIKVLIDFWMHQWWLNERNLNDKVDDQAMKADYLVLTHAHMDHIWRVAQLVKKWFKWQIVTTNITKQLMVLMLSDYVKLTKDKIESLEKENKNKWLKLRRFLKLIKLDKELKRNNLEKKDKEKKQNSFNKIIWDSDSKNVLKETRDYLKKMWVNDEWDIEGVLNSNIPVLLYDMDDIYKTMGMVSTLEIWEELDLMNHIVITNLDSEIIGKIPSMVKNEWYNETIYVAPYLKSQIISNWNSKIKEVYTISKENKELRTLLRIALWITNNESEYLAGSDMKLEEAEELLLQYNINSRKSIDDLKLQIPELEFTKEDIDKATSLLKSTFNHPNEKVVEAFKLRFYDAWHIEWSVTTVITAVTKRIEHITSPWFNNKHNWGNGYSNTIKEHKNFCFSWDRWKTTDPNLSWRPEIPDLRMDYYQSEATYAWREHPSKSDEFIKLIEEINITSWKVLIPAFSLQRIQEIIVELIQNKIDNKDEIEKLKKLKKSYKKNNLEYTKLVVKWDNLTDEEKLKRDELFIIITNCSLEMNQYSSLFLDSIILDSPLWKRVTDIFLENLWSKYKLLDRLIQKELFWKEVVRVLEKWEHKMLYKDKRAKSKEIIISSGWMLQWWAVINHLKEIISDVNAKIIFTWYQSVWTIWNKILSWDKQIIIEWEIYDVKCSVTQVKWYSSHIGHSDLVEEIWVQMHYSKKAIVALNHWWESRMILADAIKNICSRVNVIMPNLYDDINISL